MSNAVASTSSSDPNTSRSSSASNPSDSSRASTAASRRNRLYLVILVVIVLLMALIRPGDVPFGNDEPKLLQGAQRLNMNPSVVLGIHLPFSVGTFGLSGTRGWRYGPLPVWIYQIFLTI